MWHIKRQYAYYAETHVERQRVEFGGGGDFWVSEGGGMKEEENRREVEMRRWNRVSSSGREQEEGKVLKRKREVSKTYTE